MKKWLLIAPLGLMFACGGNETPQEEVLVLDEYKDRIGYVLGSLNAQSILQGGDRMDELNKELLIKGFNDNLNEKDCSDCDAVLVDLFGPYYQDFDTNHIDAGSECLGRKNGFAFFADMKRMGASEKMNMELVKAGFKHGIYKTDTLIDEAERRQMVGDFIMDLNQIAGTKMIEEAKKIEGVQVFDNGIVLQVIEEGKGGMPSETDDVEVEYILTSAFGDTIQSSYEMKQMTGSNEPVALSLNGGVIPGWTFVLPKMKKGGKYRAYIPWEMAYGAERGKESLCFFIELIDYGPQGSLVKEPMQ